MPLADGWKVRDQPWTGWNGVLSYRALEIPGYKGSIEGGHLGYMGVQATESESHPQWRLHHKGDLQGDVGGGFLMRRQYVETPVEAVFRALSCDFGHPDLGRVVGSFKGGIIPTGIPANPFTPFEQSSNAELDAWGTTAIANCKPTASAASAANTLIELYHEGVPHLLGSLFWKDRTIRARSAGSEYLNYEFGFKPLANDIAKFAYAVVYADKIMRQFERDLGRVVRRRFDFPPLTESSERVVLEGPWLGSMIPDSTLFYLPRDKVSTAGRTVLVTEKSVRRWFSGAFTNYVPHHEAFGALSDIQQLLGLELTPEVIWNAAPWSWAVDWFTNTGDVISNLQSFEVDGLVMRYGYIMEHVVTKSTYYHQGPTNRRWDGNLAPQPMTFVTETKVRKRANPFGFGLTFDSLSSRQKAIAAALGLSRT
ncbi:TPA_asm: maturation protein [ssRNA phage Gephyllon.3_13]|uniref:Maturation protein n=2 Tax=Leviviricetes TaxID=2842243 RepID=A0A8S5KZS8_9VIRU|nr:maturation protein [ssRNA phage Gephyllon.3_13]QDH86988.1 MAG: hypothetical protein H3BulkLitter17443_000001 [Leviviridae sp.]DAD50581.1 TPA_asm: maturation protein [ssRNA phage Gephyllon.3_13]